MLHRMHDSELIIHYTLDHAGIMIVTDLIRDMPEMDVISTFNIFGKMQLCSSDDLGLSQPSISKVITQTFITLSELYYVTVHFLKKVKM